LKKGKSSADISTMLNSENNRLVDSKRKNEILLADKQAELASFANIDYKSIEALLEAVESEIKGEEERLRAINQADNKKALESKIKALREEVLYLEKQDEIKDDKIRMEIYSLEDLIEQIKERQALPSERRIENLTKEYNELKVSEFDETKKICSLCKQELSKKAIEELRAIWERNKEEDLQDLKEEILNEKRCYEDIKEKYTNKLALLENAKQELADFKSNPRIAELETEIATLQAELEKCETNEIDTSHLDELKSRRNFLIVELGKKDSHDKLKAKIASLYAEQRELVNAEIVLAKKRQQLEQYTLDIISLVNDSINSHFDGVKFKLFEELTATASKNIRECCTITHNGIEYQSCSTGEKALVNLIIVSTLQNKLGTKLCLFADDASILNIPNPPDTQIIYLVNQKGKKLDCTRIDNIY
jgi:hypothetical protein